MIVSHKHKFIFVKTHKTATQTFLKFIKPHLGADDVMAGDPEEINSDGVVINEDTQINCDKKFQTGLCAKDYQETYGNHLPWFMIKDIVGDDVWNEYTKITIEREPHDRLLSLFYFMNPQVTGNGMIFPSPDLKKSHVDAGTIPDMVKWIKEETLLTLYPDYIRSYFEDWLLTQLEAEPLDLTDPKTYGSDSHENEINIYKQTADKLKLKRFAQLPTTEIAYTDPNNSLQYMYFPYTNQTDVLTWRRPYERSQHLLGQCRFLNYGNYFDGKKLQVDHIIDFKNVGNNIGKCFKKFNINIQCNKSLYDQATQNAHYRKNIKGKPSNDWWYNGPRGEWLRKVIKRRFYNDDMNKNQINFNKIISK